MFCFRSQLFCSSLCNLNGECSAFEFDSNSNICNLGMKDGIAISNAVDSITLFINNDFDLKTDGN